MVKLLILAFSIGLAVMTSLLMNLTGDVLGGAIVGFTFAYIVAFIILFFVFAIFFSLPISKKSPKTSYSKFYRTLYTMSVWFALSLFGVHTNVVGYNKVPKGTTFLLIQNHLSNVDPLITNGVFKRYPMIFVSKESLFNIPFFGKYIHRIGFVKLKREVCKEDMEELNRAKEWLEKGTCSVAIYPEGTRNKNYPETQLLPFHPGSFAIAKKANKPVVISVIKGTKDINNMLLLKIHPVTVEILDVITPEQYENWTNEELCEKARNILIDGLNKPSGKGFTKIY